VRIGIVSPEFPPDIGGVETYAYEFARELVARGASVTVHTIRHAQGEVSLDGAGIRPVLTGYRMLDSPILAHVPMDAWHVMNAAFSWLALDTRSPVVVSVHGNDFLRPYFPVGQPEFSRTPVLWRVAGVLRRVTAPLRGVLTWRLMGLALPRATHVLTNSLYTEQVFLEHFPACRGKTSVAWVGVAGDFFDITHEPAGDTVPRLLTVARLSEPRKNVDLVLQALARLKERYDFRYTVVGDGALRTHLEGLAGQLGLAERVSFAGFVSRDDLKRHFARSDLFVLVSSILPGSHEGFGITYLEAAASGVPSLAARVAGAAEAVRDGVSGMFVGEPEVGAIEGALAEFLSHNRRFDREECRRFAREFSYSRVVDRALPHYGTLVP